MITARRIAYMIALYAIFSLYISYSGSFQDTRTLSVKSKKKVAAFQDNNLKFNNPSQAAKIIDKLHTTIQLEKKHYFPYAHNTTWGFYGYRADDQYCIRRLNHFVSNTDDVFGTPGLLMPESAEKMTKQQVAPLIGNIIDSHISDDRHSMDKVNAIYNFKPNVTVFSSAEPLYRRRVFGKQYSCFSQISSKIPGEQTIGRKDGVAVATAKYAKGFEGKSQCFNYDSLFPQTWVLYNKEDCKRFFEILNSQEYVEKKLKQRIVYIRKVGADAHRGAGVQPVNEEEEAELRNDYGNGQKCGLMKKNYIIQTFINEAMLINDFYKFDFRMFMLVASTNPLMAFYHDGYIRISLIPYNASNSDPENEKKMMLTNLMLNKDIYEDARNGKLYRGMDEEALMNAQQATAEDLGEYMLKKGITTDPNWVENYLRREMKKTMIHLIRMAKDNFATDSSLFQVFGVDFMLDANQKLWFIEANAGPALPKYIPSVNKVMFNMLKNHFDIVIGLLRSRMKRVITFVNQMSKDGSVIATNNGGIDIKDYEAKKAEFDRINMNYFEKEYQPSANNTWSKFMDENLQGPARYGGLIAPECF